MKYLVQAILVDGEIETVVGSIKSDDYKNTALFLMMKHRHSYKYLYRAMDIETMQIVITAAKGRNSKAIAALLDMDTLRGSKNQEADIKSALEPLKKDNAYLLEADTPPGYAFGTGTQQTGTKYSAAENAIRTAAGLKPE